MYRCRGRRAGRTIVVAMCLVTIAVIDYYSLVLMVSLLRQEETKTLAMIDSDHVAL